MVLDDIPNDAKFVKVATTALSTERLFEGNLDVVNVLSIPSRVKKGCGIVSCIALDSRASGYSQLPKRSTRMFFTISLPK